MKTKLIITITLCLLPFDLFALDEYPVFEDLNTNQIDALIELINSEPDFSSKLVKYNAYITQIQAHIITLESALQRWINRSETQRQLTSWQNALIRLQSSLIQIFRAEKTNVDTLLTNARGALRREVEANIGTLASLSTIKDGVKDLTSTFDTIKTIFDDYANLVQSQNDLIERIKNIDDYNRTALFLGVGFSNGLISSAFPKATIGFISHLNHFSIGTALDIEIPVEPPVSIGGTVFIGYNF